MLKKSVSDAIDTCEACLANMPNPASASEVRVWISPLSDFIWTNMVIGWPIYNVAMVNTSVTSHR
jgi:hypothetical protein